MREIIKLSELCAGSRKERERFWSKVDRSAGAENCWPWTGFINHKGYGTLCINRTTIRAPRFAYFLTYGEPGDLHVCHTCDNRACCNPNHLWLGTNEDNIQDCIKKNRFPHAKLNYEKVKEIRNLLSCGLVQREIAEKFNVSQATISDIKTKKLWARP